jgi:hypothetical protein
VRKLNQKTILSKEEIVYFDKPGPENTELTIRYAKERALNRGIKHVLVASTTGETGARAARAFAGTGIVVIVVTEHYGYANEGEWQMKENYLSILESLNTKVITQSHVLAGIERSISQKLGGTSRGEAIAETLRRLFGVGTKVCVEITVMATDTGSIPCGKNVEVIAIAGDAKGADTALLIRPAHMNNFFDMEIREIICMPREKRRNYRVRTRQPAAIPRERIAQR